MPFGIDKCIQQIHESVYPSTPELLANNYYQQIKAVKFKVADTTRIQFYDVFTLRRMYGSIFRAFYFVRDSQEPDTYLITVKLWGVMSRSKFTCCVIQLVRAMCGSDHVKVSAQKIKGINSNTSTAIIMREKAGFDKENIFLMMQDDEDARIYVYPHMNKVDIVALHGELKKQYVSNMEKICLAPHGFDTILRDLLNANRKELGSYFKNRDIDTIYKHIQAQVFDMTVNEVTTVADHRQILRDECVKLQVCTQTHDKVY